MTQERPAMAGTLPGGFLQALALINYETLAPLNVAVVELSVLYRRLFFLGAG